MDVPMNENDMLLVLNGIYRQMVRIGDQLEQLNKEVRNTAREVHESRQEVRNVASAVRDLNIR